MSGLVIVHIGSDNLPVLHQKGGAIERRMLGLAESQSRLGDHVVIYSLGEKYVRQTYRGFEIRCLPVWMSKLPRHILFQTRCLSDLKGEGVDILHFHSQPEGAFLSAGFPAKRYLTYDNFEFRRGKRNPIHPLYPYFLGKFDGILPVSRYCLEESCRYWGFPEERATVVYNGVDVKQFYPDRAAGESFKAALGIKGKVILYVGRVCEQKGTDVLVEAFSRLSSKRSDLSLVVAGPAEQFGNASKNDMIDAIGKVNGRYLGPVEESQLASLYNMADVFVLPTRRLEMFGMVAIEAQACGKPVVASDHGGLKEVVPQGVGFRFPVGDAEGLADKIEIILDHDDLYHTYSLAARENALKYSWDVIALQLQTIYKGITGDHPVNVK